jgi:two-component system cell cycle sensor histidine kinase/response regulator CckA
MPLKSVRGAHGLDDIFAQAEEAVSRFFENRSWSPDRGMIEIGGERYVLVRAASLSVKFFELVRDLYGPDRRDEADTFARNILFDLAHAIGKSDAQSLLPKLGLKTHIARMSAGPVHFAHSGWALVDFAPESAPDPDPERAYFIYDHPYSFEADAWMRDGKAPVDFPVCIMGSGYSSGWCEESFGMRLIAAEVQCRAKGDETCRFLMAPPAHIEERLATYFTSKAKVQSPPENFSIPDLFARKRMEDELRRTRDELEEHVQARTAELTTANDLLKREMSERALMERQLRQASKLEAIGRLSGGIAHDFNNLLAVILTRTDLLLRRLSRISYHPEVSLSIADVEEIRKAGERAAKLTRQLLAFSRAQVLRRENLELGEIVTELARTMLPLVGDDIVLVTNLAPQRLFVHADRGQIEQSIMNMVVNARDAMPQGGTVTIETRSLDVMDSHRVSSGELGPGRYNVITIMDTGSGMTEDLMLQIFDPFFTTKPPGQGTGLGLSTVYGIVQQSRGGIDVQSRPGQGTTFGIYLPAIEPNTKTADKQPEKPPRLMRGTESVLLVEDERELRRAVAEVLSECGYDVQVADTPHEALFFAETSPKPIDLLLTDVVMPKMGGGELAQRILAARPGIAILFMSGYPADAMLHGTLAETGADFMGKPFRPEELARRVRDVIDAVKKNVLTL